MKNLTFLSLCLFTILACNPAAKERNVISLNGTWDITKTTDFNDLPVGFEKKVKVPGMVDMAFDEWAQEKPFEEGVYWYRKELKIDGPIPELAKLKIFKAKYFTSVYVNGTFVGQNPYCFTPTLLDVKDYLKGEDEVNEILIGVGCLPDMPDTVIRGQDFEKDTYIPGLYDQVELVLSEYPFIEQIQTAPDIEKEVVRIVADIDMGAQPSGINLSYEIRALNTGNVVTKGTYSVNKDDRQADFSVPIPACQLWSPENPFLYELRLFTGSDDKTVRFGMRSFNFDKASGLAMLNGKPYYMRGTNVCFLRFEEDPTRGQLPWQDPWVAELHQKFKSMHWNSIRYCIGLPPERWYDIADSLGLLIQNEYPIWTGTTLYDSINPNVTADRLAREFATWMPEHWNHPSVVIWDAQNESVTSVTGEALTRVRSLDLSNRPWENGWAPPMADTDPMESHPYLFVKFFVGHVPSEAGPLEDLLADNPFPGNDPNEHSPKADGSRYENPIINNEYAWLWLNRDGTPTRLTKLAYDVAFGEHLTTEERRTLYGRNLAILTEFHRTQRVSAGILHFCGLGYSRPEEPFGETSDNFIDVKHLTFEPNFEKYVRPSFAPVGLCINWWKNKVKAGATVDIPLFVINDLYDDWSGEINFAILQNDKVIQEMKQTVTINSLKKEIIDFTFNAPTGVGDYQLKAEIELNGEKVFSVRDFKVL